MGIIDDIKYNFKNGNSLTHLIYINIGAFLLVNLISLIGLIGGFKDEWQNFYIHALYLPSNFTEFLHKPWTLLTYMFMHADILHILFNLLWLYWLGQIFLEYLNSRQLTTVYLLGGISGAFLYMLMYNLFPSFQLYRFGSYLVGASAAIMAVVIAITVVAPDYVVQIFLIGPVRLKYIALFTILIDLLSIQSINAGGHISHLGGALFGLLFGLRIRKGKDITLGFSKIFMQKPLLFKKKKNIKLIYRKPTNDYEYNKQKAETQKEIDRILDKIAKGGYESLSKKEKDFLFKAGER
jgi:membrane associated rhomboid family serine protease